MKPTTKAPAKAPAKTPATKAPAKSTTTTKAPAKTGTKAPAKKTEAKTEKPAPVEETKEVEPKVELPKISEKDMANLMEEFRTIPYTKLDSYLNASALNGKYVIIFDKTG